jgi:predicted  nucleic acid-binding Zn-ribbon protein|tara:strand:- start:3003 stop:3314 length:312 start_codon:yes stop_codon:yes gene_type:complete
MALSEKELEEQESKLKDMEHDLNEMATNLEKREATLKAGLDDLSKREDKVAKKLGITDSSTAFQQLTEMITKIHLTYVGVRGNDDGLSETINSILEARKKLQG